MKVKLLDGQEITARNAAGIVRKMKAMDWNRYDRKLEYMDDVATRVEQTRGERPSTESPDEFIFGLEQAELLEVIAL